MDGQRTSVSVATVELKATPAGTHLVYTEQGVYLDGLDTPDSRRSGTNSQLDNLATVLEGAGMNAERELRDLIEERVRAVRERDSATLAARPAEDVITFDVLPPLNSRGSQASVEHLQAWFDGYDGPIDYSARDVQVSAQGDLGFCSFLYHVGGTLKTGDRVNMWVRATLCCRRIDGRWRIVHDHESVPFDPATGQALISLEPQ